MEEKRPTGVGDGSEVGRGSSGLNVLLFLVAMGCFAAAIVGLLTRPAAGWPRGAFVVGMVLNVVGLLLRRRASR